MINTYDAEVLIAKLTQFKEVLEEQYQGDIDANIEKVKKIKEQKKQLYNLKKKVVNQVEIKTKIPDYKTSSTKTLIGMFCELENESTNIDMHIIIRNNRVKGFNKEEYDNIKIDYTENQYDHEIEKFVLSAS